MTVEYTKSVYVFTCDGFATKLNNIKKRKTIEIALWSYIVFLTKFLFSFLSLKDHWFRQNIGVQTTYLLHTFSKVRFLIITDISLERDSVTRFRLYYPKMSKLNNYIFLIEDCFHLPPVSLTCTVVHLELQISPRIFEKNRNGPNGILRHLWEMIHVKTWSRKSSGTVPLNYHKNHPPDFF